MKQITEYMDPDTKFHSSYGFISNREWMGLEVARITKDGDRRACTREQNGQICLLVDSPDSDARLVGETDMEHFEY